MAKLARRGRHLPPGGTYFRKIITFSLMPIQIPSSLMFTTTKIVVALNSAGLKIQFKGQNVVSFINSTDSY